jgi:heme-degrading monooxygenase HmoA
MTIEGATMFAVIFEVQPKPDRWQDYLHLAAELRPELVQVPGFIDNERFRSLSTEGRLLSLSTWQDEKALIRWRTHAGHHAVQEKGRFAVFQDYHLRVGEIVADSGATSGARLPEYRFDATEVGAAKVVTTSEAESEEAGQGQLQDANTLGQRLGVPAIGHGGVVATEAFSGITRSGKFLLLVSWRDAEAAHAWQPPASLEGLGPLRHRRVRVIRDYSLADRREAPQYYPPVQR